MSCVYNNDNYSPKQRQIERGYSLSSKPIKGSTHYLGDKQDFNVSFEGPSY